MGKKNDIREQFSKRLARYGAVMWGVYLAVIAALLYFRPETAVPCIYLVLIVTVNKALDTWAYTKNSTYEKGLLAMLEKARIDMSLKGVATGITGMKAGAGNAKDVSKEENEEGGNG